MSEIAGIIDTLEGRINQLLRRIDALEKQNAELRDNLSGASALSGKQTQQLAELRSANETLRMANSLLGSDENKRDTKLKINSLIREIDYCISQLSD